MGRFSTKDSECFGFRTTIDQECADFNSLGNTRGGACSLVGQVIWYYVRYGLSTGGIEVGKPFVYESCPLLTKT